MLRKVSTRGTKTAQNYSECQEKNQEEEESHVYFKVQEKYQMELHIPKLKMDLHSVFKTVSQFLLSNYHTKSHFTILK